ncbi:response regulator [bacterium]|nr:response regulator [bacterium]
MDPLSQQYGIAFALLWDMKKSPIRILFVEDDPEMVATYMDNFLSAQYDAHAAENGAEALKILHNSEPFDVIVADNYMPEMTGMDLLKEVQKEYPNLKVILVTAYGNWTDYVEAYKLGVAKFFDKPLKPGELKNAIQDLFR